MIPFNKKPNGVVKHTAVLMIILCISQSCFSLLEDHDRHLFKERQSLVGDRFERQALKTSPYIRDVGADSRQSRIDASDIRTDFREIRTELNSKTARDLGRVAYMKDSRENSRNAQRITLLNNENIRNLRHVADIKNSREHSQVRDSRNAHQMTQLNRENTRTSNRVSDILDSREHRQFRDAPSAELRTQLNMENTRNFGRIAAIKDFRESDQVRDFQRAQLRISESRCGRSMENPAQLQSRTVGNSRHIRSRRIKRNNEPLAFARRAFDQPSFKTETENQEYPKQKLYRSESRSMESIRNTDERINRVFRYHRSSGRRTTRNMLERLGEARKLLEWNVQGNRKRSSDNVRYLKMAATVNDQDNISQPDQQKIFDQRANTYRKERTAEKVRALTNTQITIDHGNTDEINRQSKVRQLENNRHREGSLKMLSDSTTRRSNRRSAEVERNSQREIRNVARQQGHILNREGILKTVRNLETRRSVERSNRQRGTQLNQAQRRSLRQGLNKISREDRVRDVTRRSTNVREEQLSTQEAAIRGKFSELSYRETAKKYRQIPENIISLRVPGTTRNRHYNNQRVGDELRTKSGNIGRISTNYSTRKDLYKPTRNTSPVPQIGTRSQKYPITPSSSDFQINRKSLEERKADHPQTIIPSNKDNSSYTRREIILLQDSRSNRFNKLQDSQDVSNLADFRVRGMPVLNGKSNNTWINVVETVLVLVLIGQAIGGSSKGKYRFLSWQSLFLKQKAQ